MMYRVPSGAYQIIFDSIKRGIYRPTSAEMESCFEKRNYILSVLNRTKLKEKSKPYREKFKADLFIAYQLPNSEEKFRELVYDFAIKKSGKNTNDILSQFDYLMQFVEAIDNR